MHVKQMIGALTGTVVLGALTITPASAGTATTAGLGVSPTTTAITALNHGAQMTGGGALNQNLANATFAFRVSNTYKPDLIFDGYTAPTGVATIPANLVRLWYVQDADSNNTVPAVGWDWLNTTATDDTADDTFDAGKTPILADSYNINVAARFPGTFRFHFVDIGHESGTDDDVVSPEITMTVLDVNHITASSLSDDWQPAMTAPTTVGVTKSMTAGIDMASLSGKDARGSSGGVGVLASQTSKLVGGSVNSADYDALRYDVRNAGVWPFIDYAQFASGVPYGSAGAAGQVTAAGTITVPAQTMGIPTLRHEGTLDTEFVLTRTGVLPLTDATPLVYSLATPSIISTDVRVNVPNVVTLTVNRTGCVGPCDVTVSGVAEGASTVTVRGQVGGTQSVAKTFPVATDHTYTGMIHVTRTTKLQASTDSGASDATGVTVKVTEKLTGKITRKGKTLKVTGTCSPAKCTAKLYVAGSKKAQKTSTASGGFSFTYKLGSATKKYKVTVTAQAINTLRGSITKKV
jgi:hypothetical protein